MTVAAALMIVYALFCIVGVAIDTYSAACYVVGHRRPAAPGIPLAGLMLYVLAAMWRSFVGARYFFVHWELLVLLGFHLVAHVVVPLADRLLLKATTGSWGRSTRIRTKP